MVTVVAGSAPHGVAASVAAPAARVRPAPGSRLVLYDGVCGLCNRFLAFTLRRDTRGMFLFAPLQGPLAHEILARHGRNAAGLDSVVLVDGFGLPGERVVVKSRAVLRVVALLPAPWRWLAVLRFLPRALLDLGYDAIAAVRYRVFGRYDSCPAPPPHWRDRFIDS